MNKVVATVEVDVLSLDVVQEVTDCLEEALHLLGMVNSRNSEGLDPKWFNLRDTLNGRAWEISERYSNANS